MMVTTSCETRTVIKTHHDARLFGNDVDNVASCVFIYAGGVRMT